MIDYGKMIDTILKRYVTNRLILGIDGLSRSGKTTFVDELNNRLIQEKKTVCIFHIDDHIVERKHRYNTGFESWYEYYNLQWDVELIRNQFFSKLNHAEAIELPFYNSALDKVEIKSVHIPSNCMVIVEGVFLQRPEWRDFFDFILYLDCPKDTRFERESASTRENIEKFRSRYWKAEDYYLESVDPIANADMIINS